MGFFQSHDLTVVPRALPRGREGIPIQSNFMKISLEWQSLYTDDSCEMILKC